MTPKSKKVFDMLKDEMTSISRDYSSDSRFRYRTWAIGLILFIAILIIIFIVVYNIRRKSVKKNIIIPKELGFGSKLYSGS